MRRLNRAEKQEVTRERILEAARAEFVERGFRRAGVDVIAHRAELTRGAVYSNFPSKRAVFLSVLAAEAESLAVTTARVDGPAGTSAESAAVALGVFARTWLEQLPESDSGTGGVAHLRSPRLAIDLVPELVDDARLRDAFAQLLDLDVALLGTCLARLAAAEHTTAQLQQCWDPIARTAVTDLCGAIHLSFIAPAFVDAATVIERIIGLASHTPAPTLQSTAPASTAPVEVIDEQWSPPACRDLLHATDTPLHSDGVITLLGLGRLREAATDILRARCPAPHTLVLVTADPAECALLARLALADVSRGLRRAFPPSALPPTRIVVDTTGAVAAACGVRATDDTIAAVCIRDGRLVRRAIGAHAWRSVDTESLAPLNN